MSATGADVSGAGPARFRRLAGIVAVVVAASGCALDDSGSVAVRRPIDAPAGLWPHILDAGFVSEQEKHEAMAGAVAFLHPSVNESFGIVLLEAFLAGTPGLVHAKSRVLVSQCKAAGAGLWFRHYPDFETQLLYLLDHPDARAALGARGREFVAREYAWPAIERKFFGALDGLRPRAV